MASLRDPNPLLRKVKFSVNKRLEIKGEPDEETVTQQIITNPTSRVIAFKQKNTSPALIRQHPGCGYIEPNGKAVVTITIGSLSSRDSLPKTQRISTILAVAPQNKPDDPLTLWKQSAMVAGIRRHEFKLKFKLSEETDEEKSEESQDSSEESVEDTTEEDDDDEETSETSEHSE